MPGGTLTCRLVDAATGELQVGGLPIDVLLECQPCDVDVTPAS
jgi:hypothetical protein